MAAIATFHRITEQTRLPQRADRTAAGTLPTRAARYCHAVTSACAFGWYIFPPLDMSLLWDAHDIFWRWPGHDEFLPLGAAQYPGLAEHFDALAPEVARGCAPPMLTALPEPGTLQIWTGLLARTAPDWSLLLRPLANFPRPTDAHGRTGAARRKLPLRPGAAFAPRRVCRCDRGRDGND
jgi:hypothetical protein